MRTVAALALVSSGLLFAACGGGDMGTEPDDAGSDAGTGTEKTYKISASVVGLTGSGLVLQDASGASIPVTAGAATQTVTIAAAAKAGTAYDVSVKTQPSAPTQRCVVTGGKGTVVAGDVTSILVNCTAAYTVGGTVRGLAGKNLILQNNAGDDLTLNANGQFAFPTPLADGAAYAITVKQNPTDKWQTCTVSTVAGGDASGTIQAANVTNVAVVCKTTTFPLNVKVTGLQGGGLVVQNNAANDLAIATDGTFPFAGFVESGSPYALTVKTQPARPTQTCTFGAGVGAGTGVVAGGAVTVDLTCTTDASVIGGTLTGLRGNGLVLQNNLGDDLVLNAAQNGPFRFATKVLSGGNYAVSVKTQPNGVAGETCVVNLGSGPVLNTDIATVKVTCQTSKTVFVTSTLYNGDLGGLAGADAKCQARAEAAGVAGNYKAWLSDATGSPATRFAPSAVPYTLVDGTVIANNWADLIDGNLVAKISKTELGGAVPVGNTVCGGGGFPTVWSNTTASGALRSAGGSCANWTSLGAQGAAWGNAGLSTSGWSDWCSGGECSSKSPIYCFQQ
jgi:hypothetical protein